MGSYWVKFFLCLALACAFTLRLRAKETLFREDFEMGLKPIWKKVEFTGETQHAIEREGTNSFLRARASASASGLAVKLESLSLKTSALKWRWKIDQVPPDGSDADIKKFDHTARLFVAFKTFIGPPKTINYVWANQARQGSSFQHPNSGRSRFIVLQTGNAKAGAWQTEERDLTADWKLLFGDEDPPAMVGLGFMTDSDGTKSTVTGCYDAIELTAGK